MLVCEIKIKLLFSPANIQERTGWQWSCVLALNHATCTVSIVVPSLLLYNDKNAESCLSGNDTAQACVLYLNSEVTGAITNSEKCFTKHKSTQC